MATRKTGAAADTADEAQQPGEPVADTGGSRAQTTLEMLKNTVEVSQARVLGEIRPELRDLKNRLENIEALNDATSDDDAISVLAQQLTKLEESLAARTVAVDVTHDDTAARESFAEMSDRINDLARTTGQELENLRTSMGHAFAEMGERAPGVTPGLGAARKVLALMRAVTEIGKERQANLGEGGNYAFRGVDDAMNAVGSAMRNVGLILRQEVVEASHGGYSVDKVNKQGTKWGETRWSTTRVHMRYVFVDPDDGSEHPVEGYGVGKDSGDKDGSKAMAAAMKYALFQGLCIPVKGMNIDPEEDHPDSGSERYAPDEEPPASPREPTRDELAMRLLAWAQKTGLRRADLEHQINEADARGLLDVELTHPQTGFRTTLIEHLNPILHMIPEA